jgi:N-acetylmuramoyl-L-alanine amidase
MKIINHQLSGESIQHLNCPKNKQKFPGGAPDTIIIHYTAGSSAESSARYLCRDEVKASAHIVIGKDGQVYQLVPFNTKSWHTGQSEYNGRKSFNNFSIGVEIDNAGVLTKAESGYRTWFSAEIPPKNVLKAKHRNETVDKYWETYTKKQLRVCQDICELLIKEYNIKYILDHDEVSPGIKLDPKPAFPMEKFRELLFDAFEKRMLRK